MIRNKKLMKKLAGIALAFTFVFGMTACSNTTNSTKTQKETTQTTKGIEKEMEPYYVDVNWLKDNLNKVIILDARDPKEYKVSHIPGALNVTWQSLSNMKPKQGQPDWGVVLPQDELAKKLGSLGIDGSKEIIIYNDPKGLGEEGRVLWMLRLAGLQNSKMLNGGWTQWVANKGEKDATEVKPTAVDFKIANPDMSLIATTEEVKNKLGKVKLIDTRSLEEFEGKSNHGENVNGEKALGRIKGAIHMEYRECYNDDGTIKSIADLKALFEKKGLKPEDEIITYCTVGIRSGFTAEILKMCGYKNVKNYNASFSEWAGQGLPFEK